MLPNLCSIILIPVDFYENTEAAFEQTVELANAGISCIHLLHIFKPNNIFPQKLNKNERYHYKDYASFEDAVKKLNEWKAAMEETMPGTTVKMHVERGNVYDKIVETAKKIGPQVIIMTKKRKHNFFSLIKPICPDELSRSTNCPVLNVVKRSINTRMKTIVVPVRNFIPERKIAFLAVFAKIFRSKIILLGLHKSNSDKEQVRKSLLDTYRILQTVMNNPIECHLLHHSHFPKAVLNFVKKVNADIIFVNPEVETKISSFNGRHINESLGPASSLNILYLQPYPLE